MVMPFNSLKVEGPIAVFIGPGPNQLTVVKERGSFSNPSIMQAGKE